jgi:hypothetical protein
MPAPYIHESHVAQEPWPLEVAENLDGATATILNKRLMKVGAKYLTVFCKVAVKCQSPIEHQLLAAFFASEDYGPNSPKWQFSDYDPSVEQVDNVCGYIQSKVGKYRADMMIVVKKPFSIIVVECDGHNFHERTKKQASHDRSRDRWMTARGIKVQRFTGAEIYADPYSCAQEVMEILHQ